MLRASHKAFSDEEVAELAVGNALENSRSKFDPVFGIEANHFCQLPAVQQAADAATRFRE